MNSILSNIVPDGTHLTIPSKSNRFTCICCKVRFDSSALQRAHFKTEWHSYNLKRKVCKLDPIDVDAFELIRNNSDQPTSDAGKDVTHETLTDRIDEEAVDDDDDDWGEIDDQDALDQDYDEEEIEEMLSKVVKNDTCLFCDHKSPSIKSNLHHMDTVHGFFIPEEQYLTDLDGLMEYLGFKVGAGATCLWCNKQFTTLHGVRLHMLYKDHCKILYDHEKASEFKEFYDYSNQVQIPMKPISELVIARKPRSDRYQASKSKALTQLKNSKLSRQQLIKSGQLSFLGGNTTYKGIKRFNAERAKTLLRTQMANNMTVRGRYRNQNPL